MRKLLLLWVLILGSTFGFATAAVAQDSGLYVGIGVGHPSTHIADLTTENQPINNLISGSVIKFAASHNDSSNNTWMVFGGYQLNKFLAAEILYSTLGEYTREATGTAPIGALKKIHKYQTFDNLKLDGFGLSALASLPVTDRFSVFGKFGVFQWSGKLSHVTDFLPSSGIQLDSVASTDKDSGYSSMMGLGVRFKFKHGISALAEWMRINNVGGNLSTGTSAVRVLSAGMQVNF